MLRNEAYTAERLEVQLEDAQRRFLSDRTRNRFDAVSGSLLISKIQFQRICVAMLVRSSVLVSAIRVPQIA